MSRHAQPREIAELKGATRHDPQRYQLEPVAVDQPLGEAPTHLDEGGQRTWYELALLAPRGVLRGADRVALEIGANLLWEYRQNPKEFAVGKYTHLIGILARLGMTPADRQKLGTAKPSEINPFDEF